MNITRVVLLGLSLIFLLSLSSIVVAQNPDARFYNLEVTSDEENIYITVDIELSGIEITGSGSARYNMIGVFLIGRQVVTGTPIFNQYGEDGLELMRGVVLDDDIATVTREYFFWEGAEFTVPRSILPVGDYNWSPSFEVFDLLKETDYYIGRGSFSDPDYYIEQDDIAGEPDDSTVSLNIVQHVYQRGDEYLELHFDFTTSDFEPGTKLEIIATPMLADSGYQHVISTASDPKSTDISGFISDQTTVEIGENGHLQMMDIFGNPVVLKWAIANFPSGSYAFYPRILVREVGGEDIYEEHFPTLEITMGS